jgi:glutamyl-tRNA reductase
VRLEEKARELDLHRTHWSPAKTDEFMGEMSTEYNVMLSSTMRKFAMRVNVMDSQLAQKITKHGDRFEDKVTDWFRAYAKRNANDSCESLSEILADGENQVYRMIHNYKFRK